MSKSSKKKRQKHDYTSEAELNSLLIRERNKLLKITTSTKYNPVINKYIALFVTIGNHKYQLSDPRIQKKVKLRKKLKNRITELSEMTTVDMVSHERFGEIILLMIKHILTKPNFSGYTYGTEFYSDAIHKILKYLHNFNHKLISKRSGSKVNAFAYISQIIHNSIVFIIKKKKREQLNVNNLVSLEITNNSLNIKDHRKENASTYYPEENVSKKIRIKIKTNIIDELKKILEKEDPKKDRLCIEYPSSYKISLEEYYDMSPLLKNISIIRY